MKDFLILIVLTLTLILTICAINVTESPSSHFNRMTFHFDWDNYEEIRVHPGITLEIPLGCIISVPKDKTLIFDGNVYIETLEKRGGR